jgi:hypothetical protein
MKDFLKLDFVRNTLGVNFLQTKTLTKWLSELSQKLHFLLSYWQPAYSYGQTLTPQTQQQLQAQTMKFFAFQAQLHGQTATKRSKTRKTDIGEAKSSGKGLTGFVNSLSVDKYKIRVFNGLYTFWENKRLRWGLLFLLIIAPLAKFFYLVLPENGFGTYLVNLGPLKIINTLEQSDWFYMTYQMYFFSIGELLTPTISIFGIFLLFPRKYYPSYLVGVPFGYYLGMLVHRMFFVSSNIDFHSGATTSMTMIFLLVGVVFFMVSDKVMFRQNHRKRASEARIIGLINMPGMEWEDKEEIIRKEVAEVMKVDNELFIKESA